jgi:hypothetical protein
MSSKDNGTAQKDPYARQPKPPRWAASQPRENDPYRATRKPPESGNYGIAIFLFYFSLCHLRSFLNYLAT